MFEVVGGGLARRRVHCLTRCCTDATATLANTNSTSWFYILHFLRLLSIGGVHEKNIKEDGGRWKIIGPIPNKIKWCRKKSIKHSLDRVHTTIQDRRTYNPPFGIQQLKNQNSVIVEIRFLWKASPAQHDGLSRFGPHGLCTTTTRWAGWHRWSDGARRRWLGSSWCSMWRMQWGHRQKDSLQMLNVPQLWSLPTMPKVFRWRSRSFW